MSGTPDPGKGAAVAADAITAITGRPMTPPAPTTGSSHPTRPTTGSATSTGTGTMRVLPFVVGIALAFALADTRARPIVVAILVGAIIFQLTRAASTPNQ